MHPGRPEPRIRGQCGELGKGAFPSTEVCEYSQVHPDPRRFTVGADLLDDEYHALVAHRFRAALRDGARHLIVPVNDR